jgi:hypothetical protein
LNNRLKNTDIINYVKKVVNGDTGFASASSGRIHGRNTYTILATEHEVKRPLRRPRRRWKDNIIMYLKDIGYRLDSSSTGQGPVASSYKYGIELSGYIKDGKFLSTI